MFKKITIGTQTIRFSNGLSSVITSRILAIWFILGWKNQNCKSTLEAVYLTKSLILAASILIPGPMVVDMAILFR